MTEPPDVDELTRSMLVLHGGHDDEKDHHRPGDEADVTTWAKAPDFAADPERAAAVQEATRRDRERYLTGGLAEVDCRFCHASVKVKKLGAPHTAVQWTTTAQQRCAYFAEIRASGAQSIRGVADELNRRGIPSARGARWHVPAVFRLLHLIDGPRLRRRAKRARPVTRTPSA